MHRLLILYCAQKMKENGFRFRLPTSYADGQDTYPNDWSQSPAPIAVTHYITLESTDVLLTLQTLHKIAPSLKRVIKLYTLWESHATVQSSPRKYMGLYTHSSTYTSTERTESSREKSIREHNSRAPPKNKQTKTLGRSFSSFYFLIYLIPSATAAAAAAGLFSTAKI